MWSVLTFGPDLNQVKSNQIPSHQHQHGQLTLYYLVVNKSEYDLLKHGQSAGVYG